MTERPVIATMAGAFDGVIPRSKIKSYATDDLGLAGEEVEFLIAVIRSIENQSRPAATQDPEMTDQATDAEGVKGILNRNAPSKDKPRGVRSFKKPRVRNNR